MGEILYPLPVVSPWSGPRLLRCRDRHLLMSGPVSCNNQSLVGFNDFEIQIPKPTEITPFRLDPMLCFVDQPCTLSDMGASPNPVPRSDVLSSAESEMALQSGHS